MEKAPKHHEQLEGLRDDPDALWTPAEAAQFLRMSTAALARWRRLGGGRGPDFVSLSKTRVAYRKAALIKFVQEREYQSTSAASVAGKDAT